MVSELEDTYLMAKSTVVDLSGGKKRKFDRRDENVEAKSRYKTQKSRSERDKAQGNGRGHSGIPYGYTRPVDSYYPR